MRDPINTTYVTLPGSLHEKRLASELGLIGLTGIGHGVDEEGRAFIGHDPATPGQRDKIQGVLDAHQGLSLSDIAKHSRDLKINRVTKREMLEAMLDPAKLAALRAWLA